MSKVRPLNEEERARLRTRGQPKADLGVYMQQLDGLPLDDWFIIELEEGENQRIEKRRFTTAAKQMGHRMVYAQTRDGEPIRAKLTDTQVVPRGPRTPKQEEAAPAEAAAAGRRR